MCEKRITHCMCEKRITHCMCEKRIIDCTCEKTITHCMSRRASMVVGEYRLDGREFQNYLAKNLTIE
jgi:hypothetical protein